MRLVKLTSNELDLLNNKWIGLLDGNADSVIRAEFIQLFNIIKSTDVGTI